MKRLAAACGAAALAAVMMAGVPAFAQNMPGKGKTIRYSQGDSFGGNYVATQIVMAAMKRLGYEVKLTTMNTTLFFQAVAQGDEDLATDVNFPQRELAFRAVEKDAQIVGSGMIVGGGINGYLIDKKTADAYKITNLAQLKDPKLAALFGSDGKAQLISCDPGWSCGDVVDYQLKKFGLQDTVRAVRGKYEALMVDTVARIKQGKPAFFYAWSPSWTVSSLVPGKDVVWLPTPEAALPPNMTNSGSPLVRGVKGCAGDADPCRMAMASWNWGAVGNRGFIAANPAIRSLIEQIKFPSTTWSSWEYAISKNGGTQALITQLAGDWMTGNKAQLDQWITVASQAK
ncbi:glycine betaine/L-proline ABC transporter substrate-binding protein ProX [Burkholderia ambifaria]|uniref:glycine betaine/L-proline ABC transporter substrate-binding protein ProX n=1 Tax=Burkholderia ambifaria TaxID=152480 RepID=UPI000F7FAF77|nr:glycine betaine/L-proline ABC transporter substrate-binding protein ProX [Burkholderia ambifaria]UEP24511.1 glycine betaine/L-proline ABC transporter substrate-binding protein ProX [Burkholderia ambifaria]WDR87210.1 glycine betaine/L-proline ABC transporter substrate-binding protein ProX [Burkholderia ambifaria]WDR99904.1 glycine betaine/L-proline ABC transporter substrate-binding protein ProX [Burkholderia ambifaria]